ncbi:T9SS type A sorting domain-containing protein [Flavobacterium sp.]|uniref:T9SS type A sorting domain-containing protein n=1 Tax=Flavobacterium sp. TaxID=239 RepID=UPI003BC9C53F
MKKITILLLSLICFSGISQTKTTGIINLTTNMTASLTLNNTTSKATLVLTGPFDRWFALGLGVSSGFGMGSGDVVVYTTSLTDRNFVGTGAPSTDSSQDWTTLSNIVLSGVRTLTLERSLTNADMNDFQMPYATTNSISLAWARSGSASTSLANHGGANREFATGTFTVLGNEKFSLESASIYPNPSNGNFTIKTNSSISKVDVYSQTGTFVKTIEVNNDSKDIEVSVNGLSSGVYFLELQNDKEKSWKKIVIN